MSGWQLQPYGWDFERNRADSSGVHFLVCDVFARKGIMAARLSGQGMPAISWIESVPLLAKLIT